MGEGGRGGGILLGGGSHFAEMFSSTHFFRGGVHRIMEISWFYGLHDSLVVVLIKLDCKYFLQTQTLQCSEPEIPPFSSLHVA